MISVVYIPRTGSRFFSKQIADQKGYSWWGEVLNPRTIPRAGERRDIREQLTESPDAVIKLGVWQADRDYLRSLLKLSEKVYFCIRADFDQQVQSFYAATAPNVDNYHADIEQADISFDPVRFSDCAEWLEGQYRDSVELLTDIDSEIIRYESFATSERKYARNFNWSQEPPKLSLNVEEICQRK